MPTALLVRALLQCCSDVTELVRFHDNSVTFRCATNAHGVISQWEACVLRAHLDRLSIGEFALHARQPSRSDKIVRFILFYTNGFRMT